MICKRTRCSFASLGPATSQVEFVPQLPVTPLGLILMLKYFSFANDVAQLQSACVNMHGEEQASWRCRSITVGFALALNSITGDPTRGGPPGCV